MIEKLAFDKEAAQICASERATIVRAQAPRSEAQICCEADAVKNQFFNCVRYTPAKVTRMRKIAILIKTDYRGEHSFASRIVSACHNLGWQADIFEIDTFTEMKNHAFDFVINLIPGQFEFRNSKYYMAIFDPIHHYFKANGSLSKAYCNYDGYLLTYAPAANNKNFVINKMPYIQWYPTVQKREYKQVDPVALFYLACVWGNRFEDTKMQHFLNLLDKEAFTRTYGSSLIKKHCPQSYYSSIPFDSDSICKIANEAGVTLVLHSDVHNTYGLPSGRIFEAAASSSVIICDENAFVRKHFGDSVLYIDTSETAESMHAQVKQHMNWIFENKKAAQEKARKAYTIYKHFFSLEEQLVRLGAFHDELSKNLLLKWKDQMLSSISSWLKKLFSIGGLAAIVPLVDSTPLITLPNRDTQYSLVNSVDFHPERNIACVVYTHNNKIILYEVDGKHLLRPIQTLCNPAAKLSDPQHAVFSPSGDKIVVANWTNQTFTIYPRLTGQTYAATPIATIQPTPQLRSLKPHGIAFSPCGKYFAVAYGAASYEQKAIALFKSENETLDCISLVKDAHSGTPKGMTFSPDGTHLLVSFCEPSSLAIFSIHENQIDPTPVQTIQDPNALLSRPEDVKISPDGSYCAVSNSDHDTITFYHFDPLTNSISDATPFYLLQNPKANLHFPHGMAFSPDGAYLAITQFGHVQISEEGDIVWDKTKTPASQGALHLYQIHNPP